MIRSFSLGVFIFTSISLLISSRSKFFELDYSLFVEDFYINPLIEAIFCLIIGGFILFKMEKLIDYQAVLDVNINIIKGLKISAIIFILVGFWILLNEYFLQYDIATIILRWMVFPIYALVFDLIHDDRFFNAHYIVFIQNIMFCFLPITIFILSLYFIRISNKLDEIKSTSSNIGLPAHQKFNLLIKVILIFLIVINVSVLGFIFLALPPSEINGYFISGVSLNVIFLLALIKKRKWGFYGYIISSISGFFITAYTSVLIENVWGLISPFLIFFSLNLGGKNNGWKQLT